MAKRPRLYFFEAGCTATEVVGDAVYISGNDTVAQADASDPAGKLPAAGIIVDKPTATTCIVQWAGTAISFVGLTAGKYYYVSALVPGGITMVKANGGTEPQVVGFALNATSLVINIDTQEAPAAGGASANAYDYRAEEFLQSGFHQGMLNNPWNVNLDNSYSCAMPYPVKTACKLKKLKIRTASVGGWDVKLAFWANKVGDIYPGAVLAHGEIVNVVANGLKEIVIAPAIDLAIGMYWIGYRCDSGPLVYGVTNGKQMILGYENGNALLPVWAYGNTEAYAAFPTDPFSLVGKTYFTGHAPHILAEIEY